ncbi:Bardet-Biedl syndrome 2 protein homolog [Dysidea avara]|uniref:Bardet-Biedl syndrome 2 protein homolog n=1 Tax=Dysidea avara TaxID=196820 RepID=UPI003324C045
MLVPAFTLKLGQKIHPRLVTVGEYDGFHPCLTAATTGGKVLIHSPYAGVTTGGRLVASTGDVSLLNIGQQISAICAAKLLPGSNRDVLVIGTQTNLLVYDVYQNSELFYKDLPDGAGALLVDIDTRPNPVLYVGGNCSIQGFDYHGNDMFWTVTGDNVCSLALCDFNGDGENELIVGSEDFDIRVFKGDELLHEINEAEAVISIVPLADRCFGYALANGIIGVYRGHDRLWRVKTKNQPVVMTTYDLNNDGMEEMIVGWSTGRFDARNTTTGEVIFKDSIGSIIAGMVKSDYRQDRQIELICCSAEGEVRGYLPAAEDIKDNLMGVDLVAEQLQQLNQLKQSLLQELKNFETNQKIASYKDPTQVDLSAAMSVIPAETLLKSEFTVVMGNTETKAPPHVLLTIETNSSTVIRSVVIFAEGLFEGESYAVHPPLDKVANFIKVPLYPAKDVPYDLQIKALVGQKNSAQFHVFEITRSLPRFSLYVPCKPDTAPVPQSYVNFLISERAERLYKWLASSFLYQTAEQQATSKFEASFMSLRTNSPLIITLESSGEMSIQTDDMDLAGDLVQSLAIYLDIMDLQSTIDFPKQLEEFKTILLKVDELHSARQRLSAEMADNSNGIKNMIVRAEDARLMKSMSSMKKAYQQLYDLNRDIIMGYKIRCANHSELLECLRLANQAIQKAGRLRVGKYKAAVVAACRSAIKDHDSTTLLKVIRGGATT